MSQVSLNHRRMGTLSDRQRDCCVSQVVNPEGSKPSLFSRWNPHTFAEIGVSERQAGAAVVASIGVTQAREHKPVSVDDVIREVDR